MREISVEALGNYIPWVERLHSFSRAPRTEADTFREYDSEKYQQMLSFTTMGEALARTLPIGEMCYSRHEKLFVDEAKNARVYYEELFVEAIEVSDAAIVVELGGGFGYHASLLQKKYPDKKCIVGEFSPNARTVGEKVTKGITFVPFNFYSDWSVFDSLKNAAVFTVHAVEMLEDARLFLDEITKRKEKIASVTLFEPLYPTEVDALSALRRRYIDANRYNKNLKEVIENATVEYDFFGFNPLFSVSKIMLPL